jgi:hypothetical protein
MIKRILVIIFILSFSVQAFSNQTITTSGQPNDQVMIKKYNDMHHTSFTSAGQINAYEMAKQDNETVKRYNDKFHTSFKNMDQVMTDNILRVKNFYANMRECNPGTYEYFLKVNAMFFNIFAFQSYTIKGKSKNYCIYQTNYFDKHGNKRKAICKVLLTDTKRFTDQQDKDFKGDIQNLVPYIKCE